MRILTVTAALLALAGSAFAAAQAPTAGMLLPLSDRDETSSRETGCVFSFGDFKRNRDYIQLIGDELMLRDPSGLHTCRVAHGDAFMDAKAGLSCNGMRLRLVQTGPTTQNPESDSTTGPARLVIRQGAISRILRGEWGVAC